MIYNIKAQLRFCELMGGEMYHYIENKEFLGAMRSECSDIINQLVQHINSEKVMKVNAHMVGSGAKHLETQNGEEPVDLDYNLNIIETFECSIKDCRYIQQYIQKAFNHILRRNGWGDSKDSTSVFSTKYHSINRIKTKFKIDLAIMKYNQNSWYRGIHDKTGDTNKDRYNWLKVPDSSALDSKVAEIKKKGLWQKVRDVYLKKKNMYLTRNDHDHPSFNVYIETINEVWYAGCKN